LQPCGLFLCINPRCCRAFLLVPTLVATVLVFLLLDPRCSRIGLLVRLLVDPILVAAGPVLFSFSCGTRCSRADSSSHCSCSVDPRCSRISSSLSILVTAGSIVNTFDASSSSSFSSSSSACSRSLLRLQSAPSRSSSLIHLNSILVTAGSVFTRSRARLDHPAALAGDNFYVMLDDKRSVGGAKDQLCRNCGGVVVAAVAAACGGS